MSKECTYFDLNSYPSQPQDWDQWDFPAKLWRKTRNKPFSSLVASENANWENSFTKEQINSKSAKEVASSDEINISGMDIVKEVFSDSSRVPSSCPRQAEKDQFCPIHTPPKNGPSLSEYINSSNNFNLKGGNFSTVDFTNVNSSSESTNTILLDFCFIKSINVNDGTINTPISMCDAEIENLFAIRTKFRGFLYLKRTQFISSLVANDAVFNGQIQANRISFLDDADITFSRAKFRDRVCFNKARILTEFDIWNAVFEGDAEFREAVFSDPVKANWVDFRRYADFHDSDFHSDLDLGGAFLNKSLGLSGCSITGDLHFDTDYDGCDSYGISVGATANLSKLTIDGDFNAQQSTFSELVDLNNITVHGETNLSNSTFGGVVKFDMAVFNGEFNATAAIFKKKSSFSHCIFKSVVIFKMAEFKRDAKFDKTSSKFQIKLNECKINLGVIRQPEDNNTYYDLSRATLGDIDLKPQTKDVFKYYKIHKTEFDGFDFSHHMELYSDEYNIHTYECEQDTDHPTTAELVSTYLKSKNGANRVGATTAASKFFMKEMKFRRVLHWENLFNTKASIIQRIKSLISWISNWFLNISCGYGERPLRTIGISFCVILAYTPLYLLINSPQGASIVRSVSFSTQAFATLIFGQSTKSVPLSIQFVGATEGFIGAFLIALFVFALTRSIHR